MVSLIAFTFLSLYTYYTLRNFYRSVYQLSLLIFVFIFLGFINLHLEITIVSLSFVDS